MNEDQFETLVAQLMAKLTDDPGSEVDELRQLAQQHTALKDFAQIISQINESLQSVRIMTQYVFFDLEATRRER